MYLIATGSDETISRIFSQPNVQIYDMTYNSCQDGVSSIFTSTTKLKIIKKTIYAT